MASAAEPVTRARQPRAEQRVHDDVAGPGLKCRQRPDRPGPAGRGRGPHPRHGTETSQWTSTATPAEASRAGDHETVAAIVPGSCQHLDAGGAGMAREGLGRPRRRPARRISASPSKGPAAAASRSALSHLVPV
jgi:hypothetical protein